MNLKKHVLSMTAFLVTLSSANILLAHCEVPCGIYADQRRFASMLEDQETVAKAIVNINELAGKTDAQSVNQLIRWVNTKELHATKTQGVIAQYFMTQRIKPGSDGYVKKLTAAHAVMVAAMKSKQSTDPKTSATLKKAILDFYRAYEGKEPHFDDHDHDHKHDHKHK